MKKIEETLKKIQDDSLTENLGNSLNTNKSASLGDPNCPICGGIGWVRQDLPISHPEFGRMQVCDCRQASVVRQNQERLFRLSNLQAFENMTLDNFKIEGRMGLGDQQASSLQVAHNQSVRFAQNPNGWLLIMGTYGCGKTHLVAGIAHQVLEQGMPVLFLTVPDLLDWLRYAYGNIESSFEERFEEIRNIKLLVLDDLGTQNATPWAEEKLYQILNFRYVNRLPTVITTNQEMAEIEGRVRSRLQDPDLVTVVRILAPDFRSPLREERRTISTLELLADRTFGTFNLRDREKLPHDQHRSLSTAFNAANEFAENPRGWLVLAGNYGCGKTHLAAAIGNYRRGMGEEPIFVVVPDFLDHLRATFSPNSAVSYDHLFEQVRSAPLLILDDLGTQSATPWAREKLYQIFNHRYNAKLPTVITTADSLESMDPRIRSRMLDTRLCSLYLIMAPAFIQASGSSNRTGKK
ncbi:MAG: DNA replication protein DnaC [Chloroflexi bacterium HGW-Chloroflexi-10]|nr:MAG: DNA replication protein DnaC [Chloroflexi bacterium HGW-Chloroflexi-10]